MAKKSYQQITAGWAPEMENAGTDIKITFTGNNSNGTQAKVTIMVPKYAASGIVKGFMAIFKADASASIRAVENMKAAVA